MANLRAARSSKRRFEHRRTRKLVGAYVAWDDARETRTFGFQPDRYSSFLASGQVENLTYGGPGASALKNSPTEPSPGAPARVSTWSLSELDRDRLRLRIVLERRFPVLTALARHLESAER